MMAGWHLLTGEYPPVPGGVSDYTRLVATGLAKHGDAVDVWTSRGVGCPETDAGVTVHVPAGRFGPRTLLALGRALDGFPTPRRLLVQYVPHAFGWKALNVPLALWLFARRREPCWVMFHEVAYPFGRSQPLTYDALAAVTRLMALLVARAAERIFISTPAWEAMLRPLVRRDTVLEWLPVPSNIPVLGDRARVDEIRGRYAPAGGQVVGHFGTYSDRIRAQLRPVLCSLLTGHTMRSGLLIGRGSAEAREELLATRPDLRARVHATGPLAHEDVSLHLSACDVMVQPFPDGVSSRRTTAMACLAHGVPLVTSAGPLSETIWRDAVGVALAPPGDVDGLAAHAERLLRDPAERRLRSAAASTLYADRFDIQHTIATLRCTPR